MNKIGYYKILERAPEEVQGKSTVFLARKEGNPPEKGDFLVYPSGKKVQLKGSVNRDDSGSMEVSLKGGAVPLIQKNAVLVPFYYGARSGKKALVVWKGNPPDSRTLNLCLRDMPEIVFDQKIVSNRPERVSRISSLQPFLQIPGQIYQVRGDSYHRECVLLMTEPFTDKEMKDITRRVNKFGKFPGPAGIYSMNLRVRGYAQVPPEIGAENFQGARVLGDWYVMSRILDKWQDTIVKRSRHEAGIPDDDLFSLIDAPEELVLKLVEELTFRGEVYKSKGFILNRSEQQEQFLAPMTKAFLKELTELSTNGLNLKEHPPTGRPDLPDILEKRGLARRVESILYSIQAYNELVDDLKNHIPRDRSFDLGDLAGKTELSRSRLIGLLDAMEADGMLASSGRNRRILV